MSLAKDESNPLTTSYATSMFIQPTLFDTVQRDEMNMAQVFILCILVQLFSKNFPIFFPRI